MEIERFQRYIRCNTMHPSPDYTTAVAFLREQAADIGLTCQVFELAKDNPIVLMTYEGTEPSLPSILLNSHMDVVPVFPEHWCCDPFSAEIRDDKIYGRGTQDMKSVGMQHLEAVRRLAGRRQRPRRTVHLSFVPDEEVGGYKGMKLFVETDRFKSLKVGLALDEGIASPDDVFNVYNCERDIWWMRVSCPGKPGHGSQFIEDNAAKKIRHVVNRFLDLRDEQEKAFKSDPSNDIGDFITVNLTVLEGGVQPNVLPDQLAATFDIRIPPSVDLVGFEEKLASWCRQAGADVSYTFSHKSMFQVVTSCDESNVFWTRLTKTLAELGDAHRLRTFPGATDSRYIRDAGYPAFGFSPMKNTPILLHDHNEYIGVDVYLRGIDIFERLVLDLANCS